MMRDASPLVSRASKTSFEAPAVPPVPGRLRVAAEIASPLNMFLIVPDKENHTCPNVLPSWDS